MAAALVLPLVHHVTASVSVPKTATIKFVIDIAKGRRAVSPLIYGINADKSVGSAAAFNAELTEARPGLIRLGGNRWTAYNWENNDSNAGSDYEYENDDYLTASSRPAAAVVPTVKAAEAEGATALVTIPIAGYVSADRNPPGPVQNSGADYLSKRFRIDEPIDPSPLTLTPDKKDKYVYQDQFVYVLTTRSRTSPSCSPSTTSRTSGTRRIQRSTAGRRPTPSCCRRTSSTPLPSRASARTRW